MVLTVSNNIHNIAQLDKVELVQEYVEVVQGKKQTRKHSEPIKFRLSSYALPPKEKQQFREREDQLMQTDESILLLKKMSNDLEACAYDLRSNLDSYGSYEHYIDPNLKPEVLQKVTETVDWIYDDQKQANIQDYEARMRYFQQILGPLKARQRYFTEVDSYVQQFEQAHSQLTAKLGSVPSPKREQLTTRLQSVKEFLSRVIQDRDSKQKWQDPAFELDVVANEVNSI